MVAIKKRIYVIFFNVAFLASCGSGLSEGEKKSIEDTEKKWNINYEMADFLEEKLNEVENIINASIQSSDSSINDLPSKKVFYIPELDKLRISQDNFRKDLEKEYKDWSKFKNDAMKGDVSDEKMDNELSEKDRSCLTHMKTIAKLISDAEKLLKKIKEA